MNEYAVERLLDALQSLTLEVQLFREAYVAHNSPKIERAEQTEPQTEGVWNAGYKTGYDKGYKDAQKVKDSQDLVKDLVKALPQRDCLTCRYNSDEWDSLKCDGCSKAHSNYEQMTDCSWK